MKGAGLWRTVERLIQSSPTFNRIYAALYRAPSSKVDYSLQQVSSSDVLRFSGGESGTGYTLGLFSKATSWVADDATSAEVVMHEFIHAAGVFFAVSGAPGSCSSHMTWRDACDTLLAKMRAEVEATEARRKESRKRRPEDKR